MTTKITVTGTGVPHVSPGRAGAGVLVECGDVRLQFDAGNATSLRLIEAGVHTNELSALFITHHHSDHLTGLTDVLFSRWLESHRGFVPLEVVAEHVKDFETSWFLMSV
jgi:ribonuclease Z